MYSNEDLERFNFQYQTEVLPSGESIQSFCKRNNVPYNIFSKWYKDTHKRIVEVSVEGRLSSESSPEIPNTYRSSHWQPFKKEYDSNNRKRRTKERNGT